LFEYFAFLVDINFIITFLISQGEGFGAVNTYAVQFFHDGNKDIWETLGWEIIPLLAILF